LAIGKLHVTLARMKLLVPVLALLAACNEQAPVPEANRSAPAASSNAPTPAKSTAAPPAKSFLAEEETDLYGFKYSWSAEAAAVPQLVDRFTKDMEQVKAETISGAREDREERVRQGYDYHPHETQVSYETAGQSERLLSFESSVYGFSGGAHGSSGSGSLLWDRKLAREVSVSDLLRPGTSWTGAIRQPFCILLDREREKRRGEPVKPDDLFGDCPKYQDLTVLLSDEDKNGLFDHIHVIADQYVAGPYAEGPYEIPLPITAAMIERLKADYRASFEPRPPVK
jgi:hypothetical protein